MTSQRFIGPVGKRWGLQARSEIYADRHINQMLTRPFHRRTRIGTAIGVIIADSFKSIDLLSLRTSRRLPIARNRDRYEFACGRTPTFEAGRTQSRPRAGGHRSSAIPLRLCHPDLALSAFFLCR